MATPTMFSKALALNWPMRLASGSQELGVMYEFSALEHQDPGDLRELAVVADHGPDLDGSLLRVQLAYREVLARGAGSVRLVEVAGLHPCVGHHDLPAPVDEG